ncbi:MAG: hypothetical protein KAI29_26400 [Cyclobacteriaceae bacterium]|nr:hypothetical protein [Cyclobacteriaceae bacterium]
MKITISLLVLFCLLTAKEIQAQEIDITGTWTMVEMIWTSGEEVNKTTKDQLKDEGMTSEYFFMPDGKLKLISNMTGSGNLETVEGTWKLAEDKLTCSLSVDENLVDITWDFEFKDEVIHLKRTSPDGSTSVVNSFKRK